MEASTPADSFNIEDDEAMPAESLHFVKGTSEPASDPEGSSEDSENAPGVVELHSGSMRIRAPISDDVDDVAMEQLDRTSESARLVSVRKSDNVQADYGDELPDSEGDFTGEDGALVDNFNIGFMPIRARISDDTDDENVFASSSPLVKESAYLSLKPRVDEVLGNGNGRAMDGMHENVPVLGAGTNGDRSRLDSGFIPIRAPISDDVEDEEIFKDEEDEEEDEGSLNSIESYDSALERIAASSTNVAESPVGSFSEPFLGSANVSREPSFPLRVENEATNGKQNNTAIQMGKVSMPPNEEQRAQSSTSLGNHKCLSSYPRDTLSLGSSDEKSVKSDDQTLARTADNAVEAVDTESSLGKLIGSRVEDEAGEREESLEGKRIGSAELDDDNEEEELVESSTFLGVNACHEDSMDPADTYSLRDTDIHGVGCGSDAPEQNLGIVSAGNSFGFEPVEIEERGDTLADANDSISLQDNSFVENPLPFSSSSLATHPLPDVADSPVLLESVERNGGTLESITSSSTGAGKPAGSAAEIFMHEKVILSKEKELDEQLKQASDREGQVESFDADRDVVHDQEDEESLTEISRSLGAFVNSKDSSAPAPAIDADTPSLGGAGPSLPARPAGLRRSIPSLEHASRVVPRRSGVSTSQLSTSSVHLLDDDSDDKEHSRKKLQMIRVKFLRLAHRLGQSAHNVVVAQVLYRLGLAEQLRGDQGNGRASESFSSERASMLAEEQETAGQDDLDFSCTIMVLGKSGVGKSATINSLFDEEKSGTDAYTPATKKVREIYGTIHGIKLKVIDTPGLLSSFADQRHNEKIMASVKSFIKKSPPDIVLYFDRLDMQSRDYGDLPLLRIITDTFGAAIWFNAIVVLTHASSAPPDDANGVAVSYEMFVAQRSHVVQQTIRQAAGDMRLMNPVSLVENHAACRTNRAGQRVLPNGQVWKPQLLLLCFATKILAEANSLLKLQDSSPGKPFGVRPRMPPLPILLSSLLQSRAQLKLSDEQMENVDESESSEEEADSEDEEEDYDDLPPFRRLTKDELSLLDKAQRKAYFEELEYREKLFMKKQWREELLSRREMKRRMASLPKDMPQVAEEALQEENASASVPVPMPDMALPPSFDSDNPTYRYRYLDTSNHWLVRPVLETHGWDHDSGYDGLNVEKMFVIKETVPASISGQITKDKKEANVQMECAVSVKAGEGKATMAGLEVQTIGKDLAYTLRSETRFSNFKRNKTICGLSVTRLGDTTAAGMKIENQLMVGKRLKVAVSGGALTGRSDLAYGGTMEVTLRDKDHPFGHFLSTLGLSIMNWHGDLAIGGNMQVQFQLGKTMMIGRANLNNRGAGQISIRASSSEQLQMALIGLIPLLRALLGAKALSSSQSM